LSSLLLGKVLLLFPQLLLLLQLGPFTLRSLLSLILLSQGLLSFSLPIFKMFLSLTLKYMVVDCFVFTFFSLPLPIDAFSLPPAVS